MKYTTTTLYIRFIFFISIFLGLSILPFVASYYQLGWEQQFIYQLTYAIVWVGITIYFSAWLISKIIRPFFKLTTRLEQLAEGDFDQVRRKPKQLGYWQDAYPNIAKVARSLEEASEFARQIGQGNFEYKLSQQFAFSQSLNEMRDQLYQVSQEEKEHNWAITGVAKFSDILRNTKQRSFESLSQKFISNLVKYIKANQGALYVSRENRQENHYLEMVAAYAQQSHKFEQKSYDAKEGLLGQCLRLGEVIYLEEVPEEYSYISSGLGEASPSNLILLPVRYGKKVLGIVELASFNRIASYEQEFLRNIAESFGVTLQEERSNLKTNNLLKQAQNANEELQKREDLMQKNTEELQYTQQQLNEKILKIEEETNFLKHILNAIDKTNATIEFDMEGNILEVNDMYLSVMGYKREELIGSNEVSIIPEDEIRSLRYKMLWDSLKSNSFLSGEYRRLAKSGKEIWLNGTYNPIPNLKGEPIRVIMLAQFTTEEKERELELTSKFNALSNALPIFEVNRESNILRVNQEFTTLTQYKRQDLRNKSFFSIFDRKFKYEFEQLWELVLEGRSQSKIQTINTKQGSKMQFIIYLTPIKNLTGYIEKVLGVMINITEQENSKQALASSQKELHALVDKLTSIQLDLKRQNLEFETVLEMFHRNTMAFEIDEKHSFVDINQNLLNRLNYSEFQITESNFRTIVSSDFPNDNLERLWKQLSRLQVARSVIKYQPKGGKAFWGDTTIAPFEDVHNKCTRYLGIVIDVTTQVIQEIYLRGELVELKMKNAAVKYREDMKIEFNLNNLKDKLNTASSEKQAEFMKSNLSPAFRLSPKGYILDLNRLVVDALGYNRSEIIGKNISDFITFRKSEEKQVFLDLLTNLEGLKEDIYVISNQTGLGNYANTLLLKYNNPNNQQNERLMFFNFI